MNNYCKECLVHSWGKSPERKRLEKDYNKGYYQRNRDKILMRASERNAKKDYDVLTAPLRLYDGPEDFFDYSKKALKAVANALNESVDITKKVSKTIRNGAIFVKDQLKKPIKVIMNTPPVKAIKSVLDKINYYLSKSTI